jgi:RND family efflux transporter MFP subunit
MKKRVWQSLGGGAILVAVAAAGFWFGHDLHSTAPSAAPAESADDSTGIASVQTAPVRQGTLTESVLAYGAMQPKSGSSLIVSVPFDARVIRVLVLMGQHVDAATPVLEVGPTADVQLQLQQAQNTLTAATRALEEARKRLSEQLATNADITAAEESERSARTQLQSLKSRGIETTKPISAGITGTVSQITAQPGQIVTAGMPLVTITPAAAMEIVIGVDPTIAALIKPGEPITLRAVYSAHENSPDVVGTVRAVGAQVNPQSRLCDVSITPPPDCPVLPGAFVVADVPTISSEGLIAPRAAITLPDGQPVIFTVADGKAKKHAVVIGLKNTEEVEIRSEGLRAGDLVVVEGALELDDGTPVKTEPSAASEPSATQSTSTPQATAAPATPEAP